MTLPIRHLPVVQNWDCHACGNCCTDYWVPVSPEERQRIAAQGWADHPDFRGIKLFVPYGPWWRRKYRLNQREGDRCIFLSDQGLCRIHAQFGSEAKPFPCRLYPYILVPVGNHYRVGVRFACPSAVANKGRPLTAQAEELKEYAQQLEHWDRDLSRQPGAAELPPPPLQGRQTIPWSDLEILVEALLGLLGDRGVPLSRRLLRCLALGRLCRTLQFDKVTGPRLRELLNLVLREVAIETDREAKAMPPPGWIGRILFRTFVSIYLRKDQGTRRGVRTRGRLSLMLAMWRMMRGKGRLPPLQAGLPDKTFADFEVPFGPLSPSAEELLERYYLIKVESMQFCGRTNFDLSFWEGFDSLALTFPLMRWLARGYRDRGPLEAVEHAVRVVDENYSYSPLLDTFRQRLALRILSFRKELDRLIVWYDR